MNGVEVMLLSRHFMSSGFEKRFDLGWLRLTTKATQQGGFFRGDLIGLMSNLNKSADAQTLFSLFRRYVPYGKMQALYACIFL